MTDLQSNRDLYLAIEKLAEKYKSCDRSLEEYLRVLLQEADRFAHYEALSLSDFYALICVSFTASIPKFNENWRNTYNLLPNAAAGFSHRWQATLIRQIVDLREMAENGTLADQYRYFGIDSPRHSRWYNFEPRSYLECAMAGSFGGWEPADAASRQLVPGRVTVLTETGSIQAVDPQDLPRPQFALPTVAWTEFEDFIECGRYYE